MRKSENTECSSRDRIGSGGNTKLSCNLNISGCIEIFRVSREFRNSREFPSHASLPVARLLVSHVGQVSHCAMRAVTFDKYNDSKLSVRTRQLLMEKKLFPSRFHSVFPPTRICHFHPRSTISKVKKIGLCSSEY